MYKISKEFEFSAAHQLAHLPAGHQCARLHGHNYKVELVFECDELDEDGFVVDYGKLAPFKQWLKDNLDHQNLNECKCIKGFTTAENIARALYNELTEFEGDEELTEAAIKYLVAVRVSETPKTWAEYRP